MGKNLFRTVLVVCVLAAAGASYAVWVPHSFPEPKTVVIGKGRSFAATAELLQDSGVISNAYLYRAVGKAFGIRNVRAGRYVFQSGMSTIDILRDIQVGASATSFFVTIPEGFRGVQIAHVLRRDVGIDSTKFMALFRDCAQFGLPRQTPTLEGFLFPDTYDFEWQEDEHTVIARMVHRFEKFFTDSLVRRAHAMHLSMNEVMTMASIVEGEAIKNEERPIIAGLYYNRLRIGMRLEADPTVQYAIADGPRRLSYNDLQIPSPYNTYRVKGLPPGPINNPGRESILAALFPAKHKFLFFVADGNGGHLFARSFDEHRKNVRAYRKHRAL